MTSPGDRRTSRIGDDATMAVAGRAHVGARLWRVALAGIGLAAGVVAIGASAAAGPAGPSAVADTPPGKPVGLTVGDRTRPLDVEGAPQFGWLPQDVDGNEIQSAY